MRKEYSYGIIPFHKNTRWDIQVLLVQNKWSWHRWFPKWHQEQWEEPIQTATRELYEETWLNTKNIYEKIIKEKIYIDHSKEKNKWILIEKHCWYFVWETISKKVIKQKNEISNFIRLFIDEVEKKITYDSSRKVFQKAIQIILNPIF